MNTLIISGGSIDCDFALAFLEKSTWGNIIAVDNGLKFCKECGIPPTWIVGDFDTLSAEILEYYKTETKIPIREFNPIKDATDTQIAIELAIELKSSKICILGGTGSRLDHVFGTMQSLVLPLKNKIDCEVVDKNNRIRMIDKKLIIKKEEQFGKYVSLLPFTNEVEGVTLEGFQYPLKKYTLSNTNSNSLGVSNQLVEQQGMIELESGILLVIESKD